MNAAPAFAHVFLNNNSNKTLFLLHGTGGDEHDLIPLVEPVGKRFNIVGLRGNVSEGGALRFFARKAMGVFDMESLESEAAKLASFLSDWYAEHSWQPQDAVFVGYSNGANMILATLFRHPEAIHHAALLHSMLPFEPPGVDLSGRQILVTYGQRDQLIPAGEGERVAAALTERGASVQLAAQPGGHELTAAEQRALVDFLNSF
jgi:phospholipase/carboxylesterase